MAATATLHDQYARRAGEELHRAARASTPEAYARHRSQGLHFADLLIALREQPQAALRR